MEKQFHGLKLEVGRMNQLLERESLDNPQRKLGIFTIGELQGHHSELVMRFTLSFRVTRSTPMVCLNIDPNRVILRILVPLLLRLHNNHVDSVGVNFGRLPKLNFPVFSGDDPQFWLFCCELF